MAIKDMLVHLDASPRSAVRLALAADLARRHGAHLTALYVMDLPMPALFFGDPAGQVGTDVADEVIARLRGGAAAEASRVETAFRDRVARDGIEGEWRLVEGSTAETVTLHARYADLTVLGQADPDDRPAGGVGVPASVLLSAGRPVLIVPYAGDFATVGRRVLVGWKARREAARAVNDAIPLLQGAEKVIVLSINPEEGIGGDGDVPAADIALHLARHGIAAEAANTVAKDVPEGDVLLDYAADTDADLIVAGGYGHSRLREFAFGGVTRTLLRTMTVPVLLSH